MTFTQPPIILMTLVALLPAILCWWSGRRLARRLDDPLLPELLLAHRRRNGIAVAIAFIGLIYMSPLATLWTLPVLSVGVLAAGYPLRRMLYEEQWSFGTYLLSFARLIFSWFAFWLLLAGTPYLASKAGDRVWLASLALGALLAMWNARGAEVLRWSFATRPLDEGPFLARCRMLAMASEAPVPRFERIDLHGGVVANALALPSLTGSSVLFTDTLLSRLTEDEAAAICAHELAHLEYYDRRRLQRISAVNYTLIAAAVVIAPAASALGFESSLFPLLIWFGILLTALVLRAKDKQKQETVCDTRAVALMGDGEPLVQALTKLYAIARMPRRIEVQQERSDTHPSLARRIRDIRKAAGVAPAPLADAATFTSVDGRVVVTFDDAALQWIESGVVTHTFNYAHLSELRVDVSRTSRPVLVAVSAAAKRWEMPIAAADVSRLQEVLDRVDGKLGEHRPAPKFPIEFGRVAIAFITMMTLMLGQIAVAFVALLAWIRPAMRLVVAAGAAAITAAALTLRGDSARGATVIIASMLGGAGITLLGIAFTRRRDTSPEASIAVAVLAAAAILPVPLLALNGADVIGLHQAAQRTPSAAILLVAVASAFACAHTRRAKMTAIAAAVLASCTVGAASPAFLDRFAHDPFLVDAPELASKTASSDKGNFPVPATTSRIWLSPDGRAIAALEQPESEDHVTSRVHIGREGETPTAVPADDVAFIDEGHALLVESDEDGTTLRAMTLASTHDVIWRLRVRNLQGATLAFDRESRRWTLTGWDDEALKTATGIVGEPNMIERRWSTEYLRLAAVEAITTAGPHPLVVESRFDRGALGRWLMKSHSLWAIMLLPYTHESRYWLLGEQGRTPLGESRLGADCTAGALADGSLVCSVYDGTRSRLLRMDAVTGAISGIGYLEGRFVTDHSPETGWLTGWAGSEPVAINLTSGHTVHVPKSAGIVGHVTVAGQRLAAVTYAGGSCSVRTWLLP